MSEFAFASISMCEFPLHTGFNSPSSALEAYAQVREGPDSGLRRENDDGWMMDDDGEGLGVDKR
jgi:hypothetical protein